MHWIFYGKIDVLILSKVKNLPLFDLHSLPLVGCSCSSEEEMSPSLQRASCSGGGTANQRAENVDQNEEEQGVLPIQSHVIPLSQSHRVLPKSRMLERKKHPPPYRGYPDPEEEHPITAFLLWSRTPSVGRRTLERRRNRAGTEVLKGRV